MDEYSIKEVAERVGVSATTLRYYEAEHLLRNIRRLANGHRRYSELDVQWVEFLVCLRGGGMPIGKLRHYVDLSYDNATGYQRCAILEAHRLSLLEQMQNLGKQLNRIDSKIAWYHEALTQPLPEVVEATVRPRSIGQAMGTKSGDAK